MTSSNLARNTTPGPTRVFTPWSFFSALVLLPEHGPGTVQRVLLDYGINTNSVTNFQDAAQLLRSKRVDLVIFDSDLPWADQLACLQPSSRWRGVAIALASKFNAQAARRIHFTLPKPVNADLLARGLKAAYTNMTQQRIATYRHTVPARVVSGTLVHRGWQRTLHQVNVLNLSQTGLCLNAAEPLPHGASLSMNLVLPESSTSVHATGNIVWSHSNGRTGVAFARSACPEMKKFQEHLNGWLPPELGIAARI